MSTADKIAAIIQMQKDALESAEKAKSLLVEADTLSASLGVYMSSCGGRFIHDGKPYRFVYRAIGFAPGNRFWLQSDSDVKVVE